jgi:chromosome segregation ATPase
MLSDRAERRRIAKLDQRVVELDRAILGAEADLEDLQTREGALAVRLEREEAKRPRESDEAAEAAASALLADPEAPTVPFLERIGLTHRKHEQSLASWRAALKPIKDAIGKAQREQERRRKEIDDLRQEREAAWGEFLRGAHDALMAELDKRLAAVVAEVAQPMQTLESRMHTAGLGFGARAAGRFSAQRVVPATASPITKEMGKPWLREVFPDDGCRDPDQIGKMREGHLARLRAELAGERG